MPSPKYAQGAVFSCGDVTAVDCGHVTCFLSCVPVPRLYKLRGFSPQVELYRARDRRSSAKLVPNFADRWCRMVSATDLYGC
jgi:hypothetical protein